MFVLTKAYIQYNRFCRCILSFGPSVKWEGVFYFRSLASSPPNTASVTMYVYICRRRGGWTVRHTSDVMAKKRRVVQDVHLYQYVSHLWSLVEIEFLCKSSIVHRIMLGTNKVSITLYMRMMLCWVEWVIFQTSRIIPLCATYSNVRYCIIPVVYKV